MDFYFTLCAFVLFNFFALYSANSFKVTVSNFCFRFIPITFLDGLLFFSYFFFFNYDYELYALLGVFLVYLFQFVLFIDEKTKYKYAVSVYYTLATLLPFYAMRLFLLGYFAYEAEVSIPDYLANPFDRNKILLYSLLAATCIKSFYFSSFCTKKVASVMNDYKNLAFLTRVLVAIYIHALFMSYYLFRINDKTVDLGLFSMKVGLCYIAGYIIMLVYAIIFDMLRSYQQKLMLIKKTITEEQEEIEKLEKEAVIDPTTGLRVRSVALEVIEEYLMQKEAFYVIFIDMDGLKHANDKYGHEEGDFYIKSIANLLKEYFLSDTVVRFGGDEFLVVGEVEENTESVVQQILSCREKAINIAKENKKPYNTSFSFGFIEVESGSMLKPTEIIEIADTRMYEYKKSMKKSREVVSLSKADEKAATLSTTLSATLSKPENKEKVEPVLSANDLFETKFDKKINVDEIPEHIKLIMKEKPTN